MAKTSTTTPKKKKDIKLDSGILHVQTTDNNTIVTLTDEQGNKVFWGGTGKLWYKWTKKSTPYAAELLTKQILKDGQALWLKQIWIVFRGTGLARDGVFKAINEIWLVDIVFIREDTPLQFWGCKGRRPKRV